ncbi:hypothetical protein SLEP1_g48873 [Rubroshorea leprosula]|uniref:Uncharacterized protein n=1 Tax=Rubroshorea leprosula TaxID=152421 RepID=A0AAV5LV85_9ROSI|nr:hypothetical protein SLEP1_g48873 [Rubroshorea leprosula]
MAVPFVFLRCRGLKQISSNLSFSRSYQSLPTTVASLLSGNSMVWKSSVVRSEARMKGGVPHMVKGCSRVVIDRLSAFARPMIVSDLDHTMGPSAVTVHPSGV